MLASHPESSDVDGIETASEVLIEVLSCPDNINYRPDPTDGGEKEK